MAMEKSNAHLAGTSTVDVETDIQDWLDFNRECTDLSMRELEEKIDDPHFRKLAMQKAMGYPSPKIVPNVRKEL